MRALVRYAAKPLGLSRGPAAPLPARRCRRRRGRRHFVWSSPGQEVVFHLAALITIPYSYSAPQSFVSANVQGTLNILEACRRRGVKKLVHTSTSEVYGTARYTPIDEAHPLQGQSPYSASKIGADHLAESYHRSFDLPVAVARPFNTYGPRQSARGRLARHHPQVCVPDASPRSRWISGP